MKTWELRKKTCCLTGHRQIPPGRAEELAARTAEEIRALVVDRGVSFFGVGGAVGYDTLAAQVLFRLREREFAHIRVILVYPFDGFTHRWPDEQKRVYAGLLHRYDKVVCASDTPGKAAYLARDRRLVDGSAYCIAYCTRESGGTAYTVGYARGQGLEIRNIAHGHWEKR